MNTFFEFVLSPKKADFFPIYGLIKKHKCLFFSPFSSVENLIWIIRFFKIQPNLHFLQIVIKNGSRGAVFLILITNDNFYYVN